MSQTMTLRPDAWSPQQAARIAGALYLITNATAEFNLFYASPKLFVAGDFARTATNLVAHAQLFRVVLVVDLLTCVGVIMLNLALYELLVPVHRSLARLAAFWRLVEQSVYAGISVCNFVVLSVVGSAGDLKVFEPRELEALLRLLRVAKSSASPSQHRVLREQLDETNRGHSFHCHAISRRRSAAERRASAP